MANGQTTTLTVADVFDQHGLVRLQAETEKSAEWELGLMPANLAAAAQARFRMPDNQRVGFNQSELALIQTRTAALRQALKPTTGNTNLGSPAQS